MDLFCSSIFVIIFSRPGRSQGLLHKHLCHWFINWSTNPLVKISLRRRHAQMVINVVSNHKINYIGILRTIKILKGITMAVLLQKLQWFLWMDVFWLLVERGWWWWWSLLPRPLHKWPRHKKSVSLIGRSSRQSLLYEVVAVVSTY